MRQEKWTDNRIRHLFPYQESLVSLKNKRILVNHARQVGITYTLAYKAVNSKHSVIYSGPGIGACDIFMEYCKNWLTSLYPQWQAGVDYGTSKMYSPCKQSLEIYKSNISITAVPSENLHSALYNNGSFDVIMLDSFAHQYTPIQQSAYHELNTKGFKQLIISSSPRQSGDLFHTISQNSGFKKVIIDMQTALNGGLFRIKNGFRSAQGYLDSLKVCISEESFRREYECSFD